MGTTDRRWRWRWRRSPLRRQWDVVDAWLGLLVTVALVLVVPAAGALTALAAHSSLTVRAKQGNRHRHPVRAVLLETAPSTPASTDLASEVTVYEAQVRWTAPDGTAHTAYADVRPGQRAGTHTTVWIDDQGERTRPPVSADEVAGDSLATGLISAITLGLALVSVRWSVRRRLDAQRLADWDRAWAEVGPSWGHKHI